MKKSLFLLIGLLSLSSCNKTQENIFYKVTWINENGDILEIDEKVKKDTLPHYDSDTPIKDSDDIYDYVFSSWDKEFAPVIEDVTYTATYDALKRNGYIRASH